MKDLRRSNMRKYKIFAVLIAAAMIFSGCSSDVKTPPATSAATSSATSSASSTETERNDPVKSDGFRVSGTKLLDANGNEFIMRGINHAHTWYKGYDDTALEAIAATGANCVRLVLANGVHW